MKHYKKSMFLNWIYVLRSDLFHKSAHFNLTTEHQHLTTDNQLPVMENQRSDEISLQSTTTPLDQKEAAEDILSTDEHLSAVDILSAVDDISLNPSKYLAVNYVAKIQVKDQGEWILFQSLEN